jgi:hypothetical protein
MVHISSFTLHFIRFSDCILGAHSGLGSKDAQRTLVIQGAKPATLSGF